MGGLSPLRGMDEFRHMLQRADVRAALCGKEFGRFNIVSFLQRILSQTRPAEPTVFVGGPGFGMYGRPASARPRRPDSLSYAARRA